LDEPLQKEKAAFIDRITPDANKWFLNVKNVHFKKYEKTVKWDESYTQLYHPIEDEDSKVQISGR